MLQKNKKNIVLGFSTEDPHIYFNQNYLTTNSVGKFFMGLSEHVDSFIYSCPLKKTSDEDPRISQKLIILNNTIIHPKPFFFHKAEIYKSPYNLIKSLVSLHKLINRVDILICRIPSPLIFFFLFLSSSKRKKIVFYIAGDFHGRNKQNSSFFKRKLSMLYDKIERYVTSKSFSIATGSILAEKFRCEIFFTSLVTDDDIKQRYLSSDYKQIRLISVGRIDKNKGIIDAIKAIVTIRKNNPTLNITYTVIGSGNKTTINELNIYINNNNLQEIVLLKGAIEYGPELFDYYKDSNIFILPSYSEGIPKVLLEAMSFRLPIITTGVGGIPTILSNNESAIFVTPGNINGYADAILKVYNSSNLRNKILSNTDKAIKLYSYEHLQRKLFNIIEKRVELL